MPNATPPPQRAWPSVLLAGVIVFFCMQVGVIAAERMGGFSFTMGWFFWSTTLSMGGGLLMVFASHRPRSGATEAPSVERAPTVVLSPSLRADRDVEVATRVMSSQRVATPLATSATSPPPARTPSLAHDEADASRATPTLPSAPPGALDASEANATESETERATVVVAPSLAAEASDSRAWTPAIDAISRHDDADVSASLARQWAALVREGEGAGLGDEASPDPDAHAAISMQTRLGVLVDLLDESGEGHVEATALRDFVETLRDALDPDRRHLLRVMVRDDLTDSWMLAGATVRRALELLIAPFIDEGQGDEVHLLVGEHAPSDALRELRFELRDERRTPRHDGTTGRVDAFGLPVRVAAWLVERLGGRIDAPIHPDGGRRVCVVVPATPLADEGRSTDEVPRVASDTPAQHEAGGAATPVHVDARPSTVEPRGPNAMIGDEDPTDALPPHGVGLDAPPSDDRSMVAAAARALPQEQGGASVGAPRARRRRSEADVDAALQALEAELPLPTPRPTPAKPASPGNEAPAPSPRVLVVDDDAMTRWSVTGALAVHGYVADTAAGADAAFAALERRPYHAVLLDTEMPGTNGFEVAARIRSMSASVASVPIIGLATTPTEQEVRRCHAAGMSECIAKPVRGEELADLLRTFPSAPGTEESAPASDEGSARVDLSTLQQLSQLGKASTQGNLASRLVQSFEQKATVALAGMREAQIADDHRELERLAERFSESCSVVGAYGMEARAKDVMRGAADGDWVAVGQAMEALERAFPEVRAQLRSHVGAHP